MGQKRKLIVLGDKTTHGGTVISARGSGGRWDIEGHPVACVGDKVFCPKHSGVHTIIQGAINPDVTLDGMLVAREGDRVSCGAQLISVNQSSTWHVEDDNMAQEADWAAPVQGAEEAPESGFCLQCWLNSLNNRRAVMKI